MTDEKKVYVSLAEVGIRPTREYWTPLEAWKERAKVAEAEIERLTSELVETQDALEVTRGAIPNLMDQVERLRATMRRIAFDDEGRKRDYLGPDVYDDVEAALAALDSEPSTRGGVKLEDAYRGLER